MQQRVRRGRDLFKKSVSSAPLHFTSAGLTKTKRVVKRSERWYFLSWLSSIQLLADRPWNTDSASRNRGRTLLKATMASEGSVVWTKERSLGLTRPEIRSARAPSERSEDRDVPAAQELCEAGCDILDRVPAEQGSECSHGHRPHREQEKQGEADEDVPNEGRGGREVQVEPMDVSRFGSCTHGS